MCQDMCKARTRRLVRVHALSLGSGGLGSGGLGLTPSG